MLSSVFEKVYIGKVTNEKLPVEIPKFDFSSYLVKKLTSEREVPVPDMSTKYRASLISKVCERQEVLCHLLNKSYSEKIVPKLQITFDLGHGFHYMVQNSWLNELLFGDWKCLNCARLVKNSMLPAKCECSQPKFIYQEMEFEDNENYTSGHPDGLLVFPDGRKVLLELKTINSDFFKYVCDSGRPLPGHIDQVNIYMNYLKVSDALVIYLSKDSSDLKIFDVKANKSILDQLHNKTRVIKSGIKNKLVPRRYVCDSISCARAKRCPVSKECFKLSVDGGELNGYV